jgi:hypothetical protein
MKSHVTLFSMDENSGPTFCPDDAMPGKGKVRRVFHVIETLESKVTLSYL